jgi:hypothetical protein
MLLVLVTGCAASGASRAPAPAAAPASPTAAPAVAESPAAPVLAAPTLAGPRCQSGHCACRDRRAAATAETPPPAEGYKRFEIRLAGEGGSAWLQSQGIGRIDAGDKETCFTVDVAAGARYDVTFFAKEGRREGGVGPTLDIAEYGPKGPYWYEIVNVRCDGPGGKCTRDAADAWAVELRSRKRGRLDPCGSTVITGLKWETSGGASVREAGLFRDLTVTFTMEVKKFATQFAPGATECVPK